MATIVVALALALTFCSPVQDRIRCHLLLPYNELSGSVLIRVDQEDHAALRQYAEDFADQNKLLYAINVWEAGSAGIPHRSLDIQVCNRIINIGVSNTFDAQRFRVDASWNTNYPREEFDALFNEFVRGLQARYSIVEIQE